MGNAAGTKGDFRRLEKFSRLAHDRTRVAIYLLVRHALRAMNLS